MRFAVTRRAVLEKLYRERNDAGTTAVCSLRVAEQPRNHTGGRFPELGRRRNLHRVGNRSSTILDSRWSSRPQKRRSHPSWHCLPAWVSLSLRPPFYLNFCSETRLVLLILYDTTI